MRTIIVEFELTRVNACACVTCWLLKLANEHYEMLQSMKTQFELTRANACRCVTCWLLKSVNECYVAKCENTF